MGAKFSEYEATVASIWWGLTQGSQPSSSSAPTVFRSLAPLKIKRTKKATDPATGAFAAAAAAAADAGAGGAAADVGATASDAHAAVPCY